MTNTSHFAVIRRDMPDRPTLQADVCVVGAGMSGVTCATLLGRHGRTVVLVDACPWVGGQAVGVPIGTIGGLFSCGPDSYLLTTIFATELLEELDQRDAVFYQRSRRARTVNVVYDDVELMRIFERKLRHAGVRMILGGVLAAVEREGRLIRKVRLETRFGPCDVEARAFVDTSGDAALTWLAGLSCRTAIFPIFGTQIVIVEGVNYDHVREPHEVQWEAERLLNERGRDYGLTREKGVIFPLPSRKMAVLNVTHLATPLDPVAFWEAAAPARDEGEQAFQLLAKEYPAAFGQARIRSMGHPGIRQTRSIVGRYMLTAEDVVAGTRFEDAVARVAWPIELHDTASGYRWEPFPDGHVHYVPLRSLIHNEADNLIAAGRCVDADPYALSSIRVMGPCIAMGAAAAEAVDLFLNGIPSLHEVPPTAVQERVRPNLEGQMEWPTEVATRPRASELA
ncbi:FAD-dependent oxidoreductase [Thermomicrobium sp. CFH 73360]|uniref:FAD-dependent oxidoreductase n=1 Tax=Thermomicrobium sp. CFH 73360 TaxID=2951987 RepID=UPI0020771884|nr:FAD-dependent oxidoreductase [Thermomicrobium sp. CFH 73360]MCM8746805.1 FAD-dependent oxidoreductase [Thermomicrobium sp. CFH 73360]